MGRETISSQELADYTHVNSTQIRRDLSGFGKFGKRGVGYNVDSLVSQIRKILRTAGQHNIALFGAGHLGNARSPPRRSSPTTAFASWRSSTRRGEGRHSGRPATSCATTTSCAQVVEEQDIVVGVLAVPTAAAQGLADDLVEAGVKIIFNYSDALLDVPPEDDRPHLQPGRRSALRAVLLPRLSPCRRSTSTAPWRPSRRPADV
jgi:redox-sensing transcriptional repressor